MTIEVRPATADEVTWGADAVYEVSFWKRHSGPEPLVAPVWEEDARQVVGARDIVEVLNWAESNANGRSFTVSLEIEPGSPPTRGFIRVYGVNPTEREWPDSDTKPRSANPTS